MKPDVFVTAASVLFGFLFTGYWWILDRELKFTPENRHFQPALGLLLVSMALLALGGIIVPLEALAGTNPELKWTYRAVVLVLLGVFGYMLTELGHYSIFKFPKYSTLAELLFFFATLVGGAAVIGYWMIH